VLSFDETVVKQIIIRAIMFDRIKRYNKSSMFIPNTVSTGVNISVEVILTTLVIVTVEVLVVVGDDVVGVAVVVVVGVVVVLGETEIK